MARIASIRSINTAPRRWTRPTALRRSGAIFTAEKWKQPPMTLEGVLKEAERDYRPGKETAK